MPLRQVVALLELQAPQGPGQPEDTVANGIDLEVRPQRVIVEIVLGLADLLGVVTPVPAAQAVVDAVRRHHGLQVSTLGFGALEGGLPDLVEQGVDVIRGLGHVVG